MKANEKVEPIVSCSCCKRKTRKQDMAGDICVECEEQMIMQEQEVIREHRQPTREMLLDAGFLPNN